MKSSSSRPYALVTGASKGIGFALTKKLLETHNVIAVSRAVGQLADINQDNLALIECDLSVNNERLKLIKQVKALTASLSLLINNAGVQQEQGLNPDAWDDYAKEIELNLQAPIHLTMALKELLNHAPDAVVVNMGSILGFCHRKVSPIYSVTKAGIHQFSQIVAMEAQEFRIVEFIPPMIATDMTKKRGHEGLMSADDLATFMLANLHQSGAVFVGKAKLARLLKYLAPNLLFKMMNR